MVKLKCPHKDCGHGWDYRGNAKRYATCPDCHRSIKITENKVSPTGEKVD